MKMTLGRLGTDIILVIVFVIIAISALSALGFSKTSSTFSTQSTQVTTSTGNVQFGTICYQCIQGSQPSIPLSVIYLDGTVLSSGYLNLLPGSTHTIVAASSYTGICVGLPCNGQSITVNFKFWSACVFPTGTCTAYPITTSVSTTTLQFGGSTYSTTTGIYQGCIPPVQCYTTYSFVVPSSGLVLINAYYS